jgi:hypothetical protein
LVISVVFADEADAAGLVKRAISTTGTWTEAEIPQLAATKIGGGGVSTAEFDFLGTVTSNVQSQIDGKQTTTLTDGNILVGSAGNVATSVNPSGDIDVTNAGVFSINGLTIVNGDISSSAAIDATKIADGTVTSSEFQFINTLTSNAQTQLNSKAAITSKVKSADETVNNSATLQNDNDLFFSIGANEIWVVETYLRITMGAASDYKQTWTVPAGAVMVGFPDDLNNLGSATAGAGTAEVSLLTTRTKTIAANSNVLIIERGLLINGGTAGTVQYQWAQNAATVENTSVLRGSHITAYRLA